jgi:pimeloyl-ACP methyl ester carboxylesterase/heme-degrading monooxygenase HmoA
MKVTADDLSINVTRYSDPPRGAVPVIYVHGATFPAALAVGWRFADGRSWADDLIDAGFDVWGFDFAGYGQSTRYPQMRTAPAPRPLGRSNVAVRQLAAVVDRVRTETAQPRVVLLAHSWGSIVAARLAAEQPLLVERLLLFGPILRREGGDASAVDQLPGWDLITLEAQLKRFREDVPTGEAELITDAMFAPWGASYLLSDPGAAARTPPAVGVPNGPVADILAARAGSLPYDPAEIRCPVAIVRGAWDSRVTDADVAKFKASLVNCPGFTDAKLERGTHLMHLETGRGRLWTATRNALAEAKQRPIDTHAVIFEVEPSEKGRPEYLATAASLRPLLDEVDGFISIERFQSKKQPGRILSLSFWADEAAIAAWRSRERHHSAQEKGRAGIFKDYQIRVAHVLFDDHFGQARQPRHESAYNDPARRTIKYLGILEITGEPRSMNQFLPKRRGVRRVETFASLTNPGKLVHLVDFATAGAAREWSREASAGSRRAAQSGLACRVRTLEVLRDYGMFDRAHAPQYLPPAKETASAA